MTSILQRSLRALLRPSSLLQPLTQQMNVYTNATAATATAAHGGVRHVHAAALPRHPERTFPFTAVGTVETATRRRVSSHSHQRRFTTTPSSGSMFDTFKGMIGLGNPERFEIPDDFNMDDFAALNKKVKSQSPTGQGPLEALKLDADQIDAVVAAMTAEEKAKPGLLTPQEWRRIAARVAPEWNITQADVRDTIQHSAMMRTVMNRVASEIKSGRHKPPTSQAAFAAIVAASQLTITAAQRKAEALALRGAFPGTQACPCASGKKYKSCCDPKRNARKSVV